jgi:hypothetical protein
MRQASSQAVPVKYSLEFTQAVAAKISLVPIQPKKPAEPTVAAKQLDGLSQVLLAPGVSQLPLSWSCAVEPAYQADR